MMIASAMSPQVTPARSCRSVGCSRSNLTTALSSSELLSFTPPAVYRGVAGQRLVPSWAPGPGQTGGGGSSAAPTGRLGSIPVKKRPTTVIRATSHSAVRRPISLAEAFSATIASWGRGRQCGGGQLLLQIGIGDEGDAALHRHGGLGGDLGGNRRVVGDARDERRGQASDEDGADQGCPEGGPEIGEGVLEAAHFCAHAVRQGGDRHRPEL